MTHRTGLPRQGGVYALWLDLRRTTELTAGALGSRRLPPGIYAYIGSAHGPGGLSARLGRHLTGTGRRRWHVDYLRGVARARGAWYAEIPREREHGWATLLETSLGGELAWPGFGASDCACSTHLLRFAAPPALAHFRHAAAAIWPDDPPATLADTRCARLPAEERRRLVVELDLRRDPEAL